jgi:transcriptional regulator with XRE-family HTH domain
MGVKHTTKKDYEVLLTGTIGARLRYLRTEHLKLSAREMAVSLNIDSSQYLKIEAGFQGLTDQRMVALFDTYEVNIHWLLTGKGNMLSFNEDKPTLVNEVKKFILQWVKTKKDASASEIKEAGGLLRVIDDWYGGEPEPKKKR